jgi:hypothetical protein
LSTKKTAKPDVGDFAVYRPFKARRFLPKQIKLPVSFAGGVEM